MIAKKRKLQDESRNFNPGWEDEFFVIEHNHACLCLICDSRISSMKRSNLNEHYTAKHKMLYNDKYPLNTSVRSAKVAFLKSAKLTAQKLMVRTYSGDANICGNIASMKVSWMVVQAKKAYSDVDLIKRCAKVIVEEIADGKETKLIRKIDDIPLSADTATRRISSCIFNVNEQISYDAAGSDAIAIAVDESTDVRDIAQCCIFVRFIDNNFRVTEDILPIDS